MSSPRRSARLRATWATPPLTRCCLSPPLTATRDSRSTPELAFVRPSRSVVSSGETPKARRKRLVMYSRPASVRTFETTH